MGNPWAGEVALLIDGDRHVARLTLGALAELEAALEVGTLVELVERFETGRFSSRDVLALLVAGLRGGGWRGARDDLLTCEIRAEVGPGTEGGPVAAAQAAGMLLARAFAAP